MNPIIIVVTLVIFLVILFLLDLLGKSDMFIRIVISAVLAVGAVYWLKESKGESLGLDGFGGSSRPFTAADGTL